MDVTPARVSQIAKKMGICLGKGRDGKVGYTTQQVKRLVERDTKPGPKPKKQ